MAGLIRNVYSLIAYFYFLPLKLKYSPYHLVFKRLNVKDHVSCPYKTKGKKRKD
jgi:hypothetical protein